MLNGWFTATTTVLSFTHSHVVPNLYSSVRSKTNMGSHWLLLYEQKSRRNSVTQKKVSRTGLGWHES